MRYLRNLLSGGQHSLRLVLFPAALVLLAVVGAGPSTADEALADPNVPVNYLAAAGPETQGQSETTIAEFDYNDPADSPDAGVQDVILAAWNDFNPFSACSGGFCFANVGYGRSLDGAAFQHAALPGGGIAPAPAGATNRGDPVLAVDYHAGLDSLSNPRVYLLHMAVFGANPRAIIVSQSADGGRTFPSASILNASNPPGGGAAIAPCASSAVPCDDKPWIAVDQRGGARPPDGNVYVCWTRLGRDAAGNTTTQILFSQRTGGAGAFSAAIPVSSLSTTPRFVQGCQVAVDILGHVYVAWFEFLSAPLNIPVLRVRHAGPPAGAALVAFDPPVFLFGTGAIAHFGVRAPTGTVGCSVPNWLPGPFLYDFAMNLPTLATNPVNGDVYLAYSMWNGPSTGNGPTRFDVFFRSAARPALSGDWSASAPVVVNSTAVGPATDQWMPAITTRPLPVTPVPAVTPRISLQWYDKRNSGASNNQFQIFRAASVGGGTWSSEALVSDGGLESVNPAFSGVNCRLGDYNGVTSGTLDVASPDGATPGSKFMHVWTDTRNNASNDPEVFFQTQAVPAPPPSLLPNPIPVDLRLSLLQGQLALSGTVGVSTIIPISAVMENAGAADATAGAWLSLQAPPQVEAHWAAGQGDYCFGPSPDQAEGPFAPLVGRA